MDKIDNITFECFVTRKYTSIIIDHPKVRKIIKLHKRARGHGLYRLYF